MFGCYYFIRRSLIVGCRSFWFGKYFKIKLYSKGRQLFRSVELLSHASKSCLSRKKV